MYKAIAFITVAILATPICDTFLMDTILQGFDSLTRLFFQSINLAKIGNVVVSPVWDLQTSYDYIIVGAGSAGSVLASRLSENSNRTVLLLEAGEVESQTGQVPLIAGILQFTDYNYNFLAEKRPNADMCRATSGVCGLCAGKAIGGSSSIGYMTYNRGNTADYDNWASTVDSPLFAANSTLTYFRKSENDLVMESDHPYHGTGGYLNVAEAYASTLADCFLDAAVSQGYTVGDYNAETQQFSKLQANLKDGWRQSVASAFLQEASRRRNLHIYAGAVVNKILITHHTATGVTFMKEGRKYVVIAEREVIVSAGAIKTPQLLMLSGIGPKATLDKFSINQVMDLPVGQNLKDHTTYIGLQYTINQTVSSVLDLINPINIFGFMENGKGQLSSPLALEAVGFYKTNVSKGLDESSPDIELMLCGVGVFTTNVFSKKIVRMDEEYYNRYFAAYEHTPSFMIFVTLTNPNSTGNVTLGSTDINAQPVINENYFTDSGDGDKKRMIEGIRFANGLVKSKAFEKYGATLGSTKVPSCGRYASDSDDYWSCAIEVFQISANMPTGTCKMGMIGDSTAVVTPDFNVIGLNGLRVVDASVIPVPISGDINAPVVMMAEIAADVILNTN